MNHTARTLFAALCGCALLLRAGRCELPKVPDEDITPPPLAVNSNGWRPLLPSSEKTTIPPSSRASPAHPVLSKLQAHLQTAERNKRLQGAASSRTEVFAAPPPSILGSFSVFGHATVKTRDSKKKAVHLVPPPALEAEESKQTFRYELPHYKQFFPSQQIGEFPAPYLDRFQPFYKGEVAPFGGSLSHTTTKFGEGDVKFFPQSVGIRVSGSPFASQPGQVHDVALGGNVALYGAKAQSHLADGKLTFYETRPDGKVTLYETKQERNVAHYGTKPDRNVAHYETKPDRNVAHYETKPDRNVAHYETKPDRNMAHYETKPDRNVAHYETKPDQNVAHYDTKPDQNVAHYETKPDQNVAHYETKPDRNVAHYDTKPNQNVAHYETKPGGNEAHYEQQGSFSTGSHMVGHSFILPGSTPLTSFEGQVFVTTWPPEQPFSKQGDKQRPYYREDAPKKRRPQFSEDNAFQPTQPPTGPTYLRKPTLAEQTTMPPPHLNEVRLRKPLLPTPVTEEQESDLYLLPEKIPASPPFEERPQRKPSTEAPPRRPQSRRPPSHERRRRPTEYDFTTLPVPTTPRKKERGRTRARQTTEKPTTEAPVYNPWDGDDYAYDPESQSTSQVFEEAHTLNEVTDEDFMSTKSSTSTTTTTTTPPPPSSTTRPRLRVPLNSTRPRFSVKDYRERLNRLSSLAANKQVSEETKAAAEETSRSRTRHKPEETPVESSRTRPRQRQRQRVTSSTSTTSEAPLTTEAPASSSFKPVTSRYRPGAGKYYSRYRASTEPDTAASSTTARTLRPFFAATRKPYPLRSRTTTTTAQPQAEDSAVSSSDVVVMSVTDEPSRSTENEADTTTALSSVTEDSLDPSQIVADLTSSANSGGYFKTASPPNKRSNLRITMATEDPILPIEAFFPVRTS